MKSIHLFTILFLSTIANAQTNTKPVDHLGIKGPIKFDNKSYNLAWSSHPTANYFKQEYLQQGEDLQKFKSMLLVEAATGNIGPKEAIAGKISELKSMKVSNPFISYDSFYLADKKEYILDFVITQNTADNKSAVIAERNVYRYKVLEGNKGVMLFAVSIRSYAAETKEFLTSMKSGRKALVDKMKLVEMPAVKL